MTIAVYHGPKAKRQQQPWIGINISIDGEHVICVHLFEMIQASQIKLLYK